MASAEPTHVTLIATPETQVSPLTGLYETLNAFQLLASFEPCVPEQPFEVEIVTPRDRVGAERPPLLAIDKLQSYTAIEHTDVAIVPLMAVDSPKTVCGRYPGLVEWLRAQHARGAMLASACTGLFLLAETGLLDGREATIHWAFAPGFRQAFPSIRIRTDKVLIVSGDRCEFAMTGGVMSWQDLALFLIARNVSPSVAQAMARLLMLEWHGEGQAPYIDFVPTFDHGDAVVADLQRWLEKCFHMVDVVAAMTSRSGLALRTLQRRFRQATGHSPVSYLQHLRIAEARRRLERTDASVEQIGFEVGYENTAFFRRLFKRATKLTPSAYRRRFRTCGLT